MGDWLVDALLVPMAEELAQELGVHIPFGEMGKLAGTFLTTEALKVSLDVLIPMASSGISFSTQGITLALIQHKLREINKKLDLLLDSNRKTAKDKLTEALNALEHGNFQDAFQEFRKAWDKATEAYHTCQDNESRIICTRIKLFSQMMTKMYDSEKNIFLPFSRMATPRKKELASLLQVTLDSLLADIETDTIGLVDTMMFKAKSKKKIQQSKLNETFSNVYPFLSEGLQWTQPMEPIQEVSDVQIIKIFPKYVPVGEGSEFKLCVGRSTNNEPIHISVYRSKQGKESKLFVENVAFPLDETFDNSIMLEFFAGKMMPFRNDQSLFLCAARSGRSQILLSVLDRHPDFDVNVKNFKGEFALGLAVRHRHPYVVEILTEMPNIDHKMQDAKGNMALHEAAIQGDCGIINILFSVLSMKDINCENFEGETPLSLASAHGHLKAAELLLDYGAHVNVERKDGSTPLLIAAANGHHAVVDLLIKWQADKMVARKQDGATALYLASSKGHVEVVKTLTKRMSRVELRSAKLSESGMSPSEIAIQKGFTEVHAILKKSGVA